MNIRCAHTNCLLLAGITLFISLLTGNKGMAEAQSLLAEAKPAVAIAPSNSNSAVPLPTKKPNEGKLKKAVAKTNVPQDLSIKPQDLAPMSKSVFSDKQARLYREIFEFQEIGKFAEADKKIAGLNSSILIGHILAERFLHPLSAKISYQDLKKWMDLYADHPQAKQIHKLALARKSRSNKAVLKQPIPQKQIVGNLAAVSKIGKRYKSSKTRDKSAQSRVNKLTRDIKRHIEKGEPSLALNILSNDYAVQHIDNVEYDRLRALIASGYLYSGRLNQALKLSQESLNRSGNKVPMAGWVKGLVSWQRKNYSAAASGFQNTAMSPYASGWMVSASAYWASRASMRAGKTKEVSKWLNISAAYPRTFYGLIATRALGHDSRFDWSMPSLSREHVKFIESTKKGKRASALIRVGRTDLAEAELRNINPGKSAAKQQALVAYASHYKLPALSLRLGNAYTNTKGELYDAALYPLTSWKPKSGYRIDQALINAIVRQESRFRVSAANPSGATGLMQLMPRTANHVAGEDLYQNVQGQYLLRNPSVNLELGQKYIEELLNHRAVGQDLLSLTMAYNAGPGNLSKWKSARSHIQDPLLFIETIPFNETRAFVERVLSNYWIYRIRMNQKTPSLDAVAEGKWARYAAQDNETAIFASR